MDVIITVEFVVKSLCDSEDCIAEQKTVHEMAKAIAESEGLFGIVEDNYEIIKTEVII